MSPKSSTRPKPVLRQSSLPFTSKRAAPGEKSGKGKGKEAAGSRTPTEDARKSNTTPSTPAPGRSKEDDDRYYKDDDDDQEELARMYAESDSDEDSDEFAPPSAKRRNVAVRPVSSTPALRVRAKVTEEDTEARSGGGAPPKGVFRSRLSIENTSGGRTRRDDEKAEEDKELPPLDVKNVSGRWRKHFGEVRAKMGWLEPIHGEGLTNVHHILRVFDLSYEYGPCIGMTRLERWERAHALGLNPPPEVREILMTKEGTEKDEFAQCVFYGEV